MAASAAAAASSTSSFLQRGFPLLWRQAHNNPYAVTGQWLCGVSGLVVGMIHIGGLTRLTGSGLSMTDWSPVGSLPPLSAAEWQREFDRYKTFPEWEQRQSMTLQEFQYIYAWEYGHRMLGRAVGVAFAVPWLYLTLRHRIPAGYQKRLMVLGSMGAAQGAVGWWMVRSGLGEDRRGDRREIRVQPVRLATHLSMAMATYGALVWTALNVFQLPNNNNNMNNTLTAETVAKYKDALRHASKLRVGAIAATGLTFATVVSGALVAGNDAGRAFNTFPTMDGQWIPTEMWELQPWTRNLTENTATVQWNHRVLGLTTAATGVTVAAMGLRRPHLVTPQARRGFVALGAAVTGQFALGVVTLLNYVPISLAAAHQLGSVAVFTSGIFLAHSLKYARPALLRQMPSQTAAAAATAAKAVPKPTSPPAKLA